MIVIDEWFELTPADESAGYWVLVQISRECNQHLAP